MKCAICKTRSAGSLEHPVSKSLTRLLRNDAPYIQEYKGYPKTLKLDLAIYWHRAFCRECNGHLGTLNETGLALMKRVAKGEALSLTPEDQRTLTGWFLRTCLSLDFAIRQSQSYKDQTMPWRPNPEHYLAQDELPPGTALRIGGYDSSPERIGGKPIDTSGYLTTFLPPGYLRHLTLWRIVGQLMVGEGAVLCPNLPEDRGHLVRIWPPKHDTVIWPRPREYDEAGVKMLGDRFL